MVGFDMPIVAVPAASNGDGRSEGNEFGDQGTRAPAAARDATEAKGENESPVRRKRKSARRASARTR